MERTGERKGKERKMEDCYATLTLPLGHVLSLSSERVACRLSQSVADTVGNRHGQRRTKKWQGTVVPCGRVEGRRRGTARGGWIKAVAWKRRVAKGGGKGRKADKYPIIPARLLYLYKKSRHAHAPVHNSFVSTSLLCPQSAPASPAPQTLKALLFSIQVQPPVEPKNLYRSPFTCTTAA